MNKPNYSILTPFKRWTIQNFPFIEEDFDAITNYQLLCKIVEYLNKVIENEKLLEQSNNELIDAFNNLKSYVDNYFEELDVQDEINNKLDEMADSGQLTDIIAQYLGLAGVLAFNTIDDLADALNITEGSICYCLGDNTYNDGKGAFYKIRTITSGDVVDGFNIVALDVSDTLIAERIPNYYINEIDTNITNINNTLNFMNSEKILFIGDSFIAEYSGNNWATKLANLLGLSANDYTILGEGGAGIYNVGNQETNFLGLLQANISSITNKDLYKKIIIGGGYNDGNATSINDILTPLENTINYCKTQFPNAKVYLSCFGWNMNYSNVLFRNRINGIVIPAYKQASKFGGYYLSNTEFCYRDLLLYDGDDPAVDSMVHPNDDGQREIAQALFEALNSGYTPRYKSNNIAFDASTSSDISSASMYFNHMVTPFNHVLNLNGSFNCNQFTWDGSTGKTLDLGLIADKYMRKTSDNIGYFGKVTGRIYDTNNKTYYFNGLLNYDSSGHVKLTLPIGTINSSITITTIAIVDTISFDRYVW